MDVCHSFQRGVNVCFCVSHKQTGVRGYFFRFSLYLLLGIFMQSQVKNKYKENQQS